jgi:hypothetical protein
MTLSTIFLGDTPSRPGVALKSTSGVEERNDGPSLEIRAAISFPFTKFFKLQQVSKQPNLPS